MCQGGIYDHLGGGFARYSTDERWLVPHFEKMLYDNAQLIELLTGAWQDTQSPLYEARVRETVAWIERDMIAEDGAFAASLDADSEGEEGRYYVWTEAEIDAALGDGAASFKAVYDVAPAGNWEGKTILNRSARPGLAEPVAEAALARQRAVLLELRQSRVPPTWDDKVLADWNGLMIAALANTAAVFNEQGWLGLAARAFDFIAATMADGNRLYHTFRNGQARHGGVLDDYAAMAWAALALHEVTGEAAYLNAARRWVGVADDLFWDDRHGGYFYTARDAETLIVRTRNASDNATPSGNGMMTRVLAKLFYLTGEDAYRERTAKLIAGFTGELTSNVLALATLIGGWELLTTAVQIVVLGERGDGPSDALIGVAIASPMVNQVLQVVPADAALPPSHPAAGMTQVDGRATAYVCRGPTCSLPLTDAASLGAALAMPSDDRRPEAAPGRRAPPT